MSRTQRKPSGRRALPRRAVDSAAAPLFAALGDETRLGLVARLADAHPRSITELTAHTALTRQAVTKHLRVLERAGLVRCVRSGRESRFALHPEPLDSLRLYLAVISKQWDQSLGRLKSFVEGYSA